MAGLRVKAFEAPTNFSHPGFDALLDNAHRLRLSRLYRRITSHSHAARARRHLKNNQSEIKPGLMPGLSAPPANSPFLPTRLQLGNFDG
jgi:hypothetical protein